MVYACHPNCLGGRGGPQFQSLPRLQSEFKASLDNVMRPLLKVKQLKKKKKRGGYG